MCAEYYIICTSLKAQLTGVRHSTQGEHFETRDSLYADDSAFIFATREQLVASATLINELAQLVSRFRSHILICSALETGSTPL